MSASKLLESTSKLLYSASELLASEFKFTPVQLLLTTVTVN